MQLLPLPSGSRVSQMIVRSMTGFGQGVAETSRFRVSAEMRGLNNRHVDVRFRMPVELGPWEARLRRRVLSRVRRGRVEVSVTFEHATGAELRPALNRPLLEEVLAAGQMLAREHGVTGELELSGLLSVPGMFKAEPVAVERGEQERTAVTEALDAALDAFDAERRREGAVLRDELVQRLDRMRELAGDLRARADTVPAQVRVKLMQRLNALTGTVELDPGRLAQEAAFLADRSDVTEELVRLEGHLEQARTLLSPSDDDEPVGKRLDFLLQEIHRETNTVCSKSGDLELTRSALAIKVEAEKVREQVQNLE